MKTNIMRMIVMTTAIGILGIIAVFGIFGGKDNTIYSAPCPIHCSKDSTIRFTSGNYPNLYANFYNFEPDSLFSKMQRNTLNFRIGETIPKPKTDNQ